nr:NAD-dependent epimerase/dehydratase family protein [Prevotella sp.]
MAEIKSTYWDDVKAVGNALLPWNKLEGCNILVAGATGLVGSCIVDVLMNSDNIHCHVYAGGRNKDRAKSRFARYWDMDNFSFVCIDVTEEIKCTVDYHYIIDAASNASPNFFTQQPVEVMMANIQGVNNLMKYGIAHCMQRFLYVSTGEIYGQSVGKVFKETDSGYVNSMLSRSCYPSSKRAAETLCASFASEYGTDVVIGRLCHTYGPYFTESDNRVFAQFIRNVLNGEDILMNSEGSQYRSWCYVVDSVKAILFVLLKGDKGEAYNIADETSCFSIRELADAIASSRNKKVIVRVCDNNKMSNSGIKTALFDTCKLKKLGFSISGTWMDKINSTINEQSNVKEKVVKIVNNQ